MTPREAHLPREACSMHERQQDKPWEVPTRCRPGKYPAHAVLPCCLLAFSPAFSVLASCGKYPRNRQSSLALDGREEEGRASKTDNNKTRGCHDAPVSSTHTWLGIVSCGTLSLTSTVACKEAQKLQGSKKGEGRRSSCAPTLQLRIEGFSDDEF